MTARIEKIVSGGQQLRNIVLIFLALLVFPLLSAADLAPFTPKAHLRGNWSLRVDPNLPNILILGDSISIGYTLPVRRMLAGKANVFRPIKVGGRGPDNCGNTAMGLKNLSRWLGTNHWDVIHFNWGLWDICYRNPAAKNQGNRDKVNGKRSVSPAEYERNLEQLVTRLQASGARLIWASTTVAPAGEAGRWVGDEKKYNAIAARVMERHGIPTDDLYALTLGFAGKFSGGPGNVHFSREGYERIAKQVVVTLDKALANNQHAPRQNLVLAAPIKSWDEAVPLGNGLMGGLFWGEGRAIHLGLDRGDLWDERPNGPKDWWKTQTWAKGGPMWEKAYQGAHPSKLPAGRVEITLAGGQQVKAFELNYATAEGIARLEDGGTLRVFFSATDPVALLRFTGKAPADIEVLSPLEVSRRERGGSAGPDSHSVNALGYTDAVTGGDGDTKWYVQTTAEGLKYCACIESRRVGDETITAVALTTTTDARDLLGLARKRCAEALAHGYDAMLEPHVAWWNNFWTQSSVTVPEPDIQKYYVFAKYLYGAGSRRGAPPMPLQGVWTANTGDLPPWKGDYHNDLNTQMTYIGYQEAGLFDEGACFLDLLHDLLPVFRDFAHDFYGTPGAAVPGVMSLSGQPLGGWGQYSLSPTMGAWLCHLFYLHWRYTVDAQFLRTRAYPFCRAVGECERTLLRTNATGVLVLPRSSSPEIFDNSARAWRIPNSNFDLACLKMLFLSLDEMADALGKAKVAKSWAATAAALGDFHADTNGTLLVAAQTPLPYSHRHLSNIIALYPFNLITCEGGQKDEQRIKTSLAQWDKLGTSAWCGYTWAWMSCLRARVGEPEVAIRDLDVFVHAFISRNGFHLNGDQTRSGFSGFTYRPFTLEGNFLAMQAVQEMVLQSWSPTPGKLNTGIIRIFPSTPWRWHDASFTDLRAEGGYKVSAKRENNATTWLRIVAGRDGMLRVRDNFGGCVPKWNRHDVRQVGSNFEVRLKKGQSLEATLPKPENIPVIPTKAAVPVVIQRPPDRSVP